MADLQRYPYSLQESATFRLMATGVWLVALIAFLGFVSAHEPTGSLWDYSGYFLAAGATTWWWTEIRRRVTLYEDRLEVRGGFRTVALQKSRIEGFSITRSRYGTSLAFRDSSGRSVLISDYRGDAMFNAWIAGMDRLEARDHAEFEKSLDANPAFGASPQQRTQAIARHKAIITVINFAGTIAGAWLAFFPFPEKPLVWICAAFPPLVLALALMSGGRYALLWDNKTPRLKLTAALLLPGIGLTFYYAIGDAMIDRLAALIPAVVAGAVLALIAGRIDGRLNTTPALICAVALSEGCWGGLMLYDQVADSTAPQVFITTVTDKHVSHGRYNTTAYVLTYAPWGPDGMPINIKVGQAEYNAARIDQPACVWLHPGALGYRWFEHSACPDGATRPHT